MLRVARQLAAAVGLLGVMAAAVLMMLAFSMGRVPTTLGAIALVGMLVALVGRVAYVKLGEAVRKQESVELAQVRDVTRFEVAGRPMLTVLLGFMLAAMGAFGSYAAANNHRWDIFAASALLFVVFAWVFFQSLSIAMRNRPMITMDQQGIDHLVLGRFPWSEVIGMRHDTRTFRNRTVHRLMLGLRSPHRYLDQLPWMLRWQKRAWRDSRPRYGVIEIPLNMLGKRPEVIFEAARQLRARNAAPWLEHWHEQFSAQDIDGFLATQEDMRIAQAAAERGSFVEAEAAMRRIQDTTTPIAARTRALVERETRKYKWLNAGLIALALVVIALKVLHFAK